MQYLTRECLSGASALWFFMWLRSAGTPVLEIILIFSFTYFLFISTHSFHNVPRTFGSLAAYLSQYQRYICSQFSDHLKNERITLHYSSLFFHRPPLPDDMIDDDISIKFLNINQVTYREILVVLLIVPWQIQVGKYFVMCWLVYCFISDLLPYYFFLVSSKKNCT